MNSINYKVIFKGTNEDNKKDLALTFRKIITKNPIIIPAQLIIELKKLSELSPNIISFKNIEEVVILGNDINSYSYYFGLLFTYKQDNIKEGYLIGNLKGSGDILIGIWPFNRDISQNNTEEIILILNDLIKKPHEYSNITLIGTIQL